MNNRYFDKRQIHAWIYEGTRRYRKSGAVDLLALEDEAKGDDEEKKRLEQFAKWLEEDGEG